MLQKERHQHISARLQAEKRVYTESLSRDLAVSVDTVRRDLAILEKQGQLVRVHGGAVSSDFAVPFQQPQVYAQREKHRLARKALGLLREGMTLLAGGGTVMLELARMLPEDYPGTLFTVSPLVALEVTQRTAMEVNLIAGRLAKNQYVCTGASVVHQLSDIKADLCLMGANGFSVRDGVTEFDWDVMQVKKAMLRAAGSTALLSIAEKSGMTHRFRVCPINEIDYLVTELSPEHPLLADYNGFCKVM